MKPSSGCTRKESYRKPWGKVWISSLSRCSSNLNLWFKLYHLKLKNAWHITRCKAWYPACSPQRSPSATSPAPPSLAFSTTPSASATTVLLCRCSSSKIRKINSVLERSIGQHLIASLRELCWLLRLLTWLPILLFLKQHLWVLETWTDIDHNIQNLTISRR